MGRTPCCSKVGLRRGPWTAREDKLLINYIQSNGEGHWRSLPSKAGLLRCGKSCRLRWMNYLRPDIKRGNITSDEDDLIIRLHSLLGNRWSLIAGRLPGRTDNEIKNYWNSHLSKRLKNTSLTPQSRNHGKKIKNKKGNNNNNIHNNNQESEINNKRIKIHLPKAVRVTRIITRTSSFNNNSMASGSSSGIDYEDGYISPCQNYNVPIPNHDDHNHMLDEIFKEYEQLLKTDNNIAQLYSSIDSLFA